jgi:CDP-diacylglycerol--glycerol-3-phosphate 3-phosphatidyltransferase
MVPFLVFAQLTEYFDGKYARIYNQVSDFGKVFDPFADVFLNITLFVCLVASGYMPAVIFLLILYRELSMTFIRMVAIQEGVAIGARKGGKVKTVMYIISCSFALAVECSMRVGLFREESFVVHVGKIASIVLFILCLISSYISFVDYLLCFKNVLFNKKNKTQEK